jgi:hypothetical protein
MIEKIMFYKVRTKPVHVEGDLLASLRRMVPHQVFPFGPPDARLTVGLFLFVAKREAEGSG